MKPLKISVVLKWTQVCHSSPPAQMLMHAATQCCIASPDLCVGWLSPWIIIWTGDWWRIFSVSLPAVQRRLCHRTHQRPTHPRPASAGARYLIHLIQRPVGKMAPLHGCECSWGVGMQTRTELVVDLFFSRGSVAGGNECLSSSTAVGVLLCSLYFTTSASYFNLH